MRTAYSYIRFSAAKQSKGDSLRRQTKWSREWCEGNDHTLDDSLNLRDLGVSAFRGRNAKTGALATFLQAVKDGRVKPHATLLIESLDRLSRDEVGEALELFLGILRHGVRIVTKLPEERTFTRQSINDLSNIIMAIIEMGRAHSESQHKSNRLLENWETKRENIHNEKMTANCPKWLRLSEDRRSYIPIPEHVAIIKRIFRMYIEGIGVDSIVRTLNSEGVECFGRANTWYSSYIKRILSNRHLLGEYQPCKGHADNRTPAGPVIPDYFPQVIDESTFYKAQQVRATRRGKRGPRGNPETNLFTQLLYDYITHSPCVVVDKRRKTERDRGTNGVYLVVSDIHRGTQPGPYFSFPYHAFEQGFLRTCAELKVEDVFPVEDDKQNELDAAVAKLEDIRRRIAVIKAKVLHNPDFESGLALLETLDADEKRTRSTIQRLTADIHQPQHEGLTKTQGLIEKLSQAEDTAAARRRLRTHINTLIREIWLFFEPSKILESGSFSAKGNRLRKEVMAMIVFRSGAMRGFVVSTYRGEITEVHTRYTDKSIPAMQTWIAACQGGRLIDRKKGKITWQKTVSLTVARPPHPNITIPEGYGPLLDDE